MKIVFSKYFKGDSVIWMVVIFLSIMSIVSVYSSIGALAHRTANSSVNSLLLKHVAILIVGFVVMYLIHKTPYTLFFSLSQLFISVAGLLLIFTLFAGIENADATRWLNLPGIGIQFQTSDIAKFALIVYIARILSLSQDDEESLNLAFKRIIIAIAVICGLILPSNFSTAFILFFTSFILMFIGRIPQKKLLKSIGVLIGILTFITMLAFISPNVGRLSTWKNRVTGFFVENENDNSQASLAKTAIATSGLIGKGPGNSSVRYALPQAHSDFIYAIIIEEWGTLIGILVLIAYLLLLYRTGIIVKASSRTFPAFLAIGLTVNLVFQALSNMVVAVNLAPVTGQPLPLVSMGGTSMIFTLASLGIVLSISRSLENETTNDLETETE